MPILAIPYLAVQGFSWLIRLWTNKLAGYLIMGALTIALCFGIKVYLQ